MRLFIFLILILIPEILFANNIAKFPVMEKSISINQNRATVVYELLSDVTDFAINIYGVKQTVVWQKVFIGANPIKKAGETVKIEVLIEPNTSERSMVGVEFSGVISGVKRAAVLAITFNLENRFERNSKNIKEDSEGNKLRVVPLIDN